MKKVLIFGIGGFVGPYLAEEFMRNNYEVIGSDMQTNSTLSDEVEFIKADLLDAEDILKIINRVRPHYIVNLAAISSVWISWTEPQKTISINVIGALNILESVKKLKIKPKILFVGSSEEYELSNLSIDEKTKLESSNPYGISKITQELFCEIYKKQFGMKIFCVRPFNHTGIHQQDTFVLPNFCKQVAEIEKSGKPGTIKVGNILASRDFSDVRDVVRGYRMVIESNNYNKIYNIGSGKAYQLKNLLEYIVSLSSQEIHIEIDDSRIRKTDRERICCDFTSISKDLGWQPEYHIKDTLNEIYRSYLK